MYIPLTRICIYRNNSQFNVPSVPRGYWKTPKHYLKGSLLYLWDKMDQAYSVCGTITLVFAAGHCRMLTCWARSSVLLFSFTVFYYEITEPNCSATAVVQYWQRRSEKGSGFSGMWHLITTLSPSPNTHVHTHQLIMRCATFIMSAKAWICGKVTWESPLTAD